jgi:hypothetical protein
MTEAWQQSPCLVQQHTSYICPRSAQARSGAALGAAQRRRPTQPHRWNQPGAHSRCSQLAEMTSFPLSPNFEVVGLGLGGTAARRARELSVHPALFALHRNLESEFLQEYHSGDQYLITGIDTLPGPLGSPRGYGAVRNNLKNIAHQRTSSEKWATLVRFRPKPPASAQWSRRLHLDGPFLSRTAKIPVILWLHHPLY